MIAMKTKMIAAAMVGLVAVPSMASLTYPGCPDMQASDFTITSLITNATDTTVKEPTKMALNTNAQGNVDVYFVQRYGKVRKYDGTAGGKALTLVDFNFGSGSSLTDTTQIYNGSDASSSEGLQGIALDPGFNTNHWMYLYFCMKTIWRVTRYTLNGNTVNLTTAKTILRFTHTSFSQHMGSALRFDWAGNLWVTVADNGGTNNWPPDQTVPYQAANTNKYFGKILRIIPRPIPDSQAAPAPGLGSTYDVPAGNLRQVFNQIGGAWVAGQDTTKILPEIYVMGNRNPYTIAFDTVRKAVAWGEVGPDSYPGSTDTNQWTEEFNFTTQPGNFGWPLWAGKHTPMPTVGWAGYPAQPPPAGGFGTMANPFNPRSDNTGVYNLPPAQPAIIDYVKNCAITGPIYYYNGSLASTVKFPPHLNGAWLIGDFDNSWINAVELNAAGTAVLSMRKMFSVSAAGGPTLSVPATGTPLKQIPSTQMNASNGLLDMQMGSDGALYVMNYSGYRTYDTKSGLVRITYNGTCLPSTAVFPNAPQPGLKNLLNIQGMNVSVLAVGNHTLGVRTLTGKLVALRKGTGPADYSFEELRNPGVYLLYLSSDEGKQVRKLIRQ